MGKYKYTNEELEGEFKDSLLNPFENEPEIIKHNFNVLGKKDIEFGIYFLSIQEKTEKINLIELKKSTDKDQ